MKAHRNAWWRATPDRGDAVPRAADRPPRCIVLTDAARVLRRQLGPTAWTVLEELVLDAVEPARVDCHVRQIAAGVGISKDTAARALRRLIALGVITRRSGRDAATGCFGRSVYVLHLDVITGVGSATDRVAVDASERATAHPRARAPRRADTSDHGQTWLFDVPTEGIS